jgi:hypothetical protein
MSRRSRGAALECAPDAGPCVPTAVNIAHRCNKISPQRTYCAGGMLVHQSLPFPKKNDMALGLLCSNSNSAKLKMPAS